MKKILLASIMVVLLLSLGVAGYLLVFREDASVAGSEAEGLETIRPRNMRILEVTGTSFLVEWKVESDVSGYVRYGDTSSSISLIAQDIEGTVPSKKHSVRVTGLVPGKKYYFWVMSGDVAFGRNGRALEVLTLAP